MPRTPLDSILFVVQPMEGNHRLKGLLLPPCPLEPRRMGVIVAIFSETRLASGMENEVTTPCDGSYRRVVCLWSTSPGNVRARMPQVALVGVERVTR